MLNDDDMNMMMMRDDVDDINGELIMTQWIK